MPATTAAPGRVRHERHDHVLRIVIDNAAKRNAFSPEMMLELSQALTLLDRDDTLWVGVICAKGRPASRRRSPPSRRSAGR